MKLRYLIYTFCMFLSFSLQAQPAEADVHYIVVIQVQDVASGETIYSGFPMEVFDVLAARGPQTVAYMRNQTLGLQILGGTPPDLSSFDHFTIKEETVNYRNAKLPIYKVSLTKNGKQKVYKFHFDHGIKLLKALLVPIILKDGENSSQAPASIDDMLDDMNMNEAFEHHEGPAPLTGAKGFFAYLFSKCPSKLQEWILKII